VKEEGKLNMHIIFEIVLMLFYPEFSKLLPACHNYSLRRCRWSHCLIW